MSFDGTGTYYPPSPEFPAVAGTVILASDFNTIIEDIADALSVTFLRDGSSTMTGDLAMGGQEIKGLGGGTLTLPGIRFQGDPDTGMWHEEEGKLALVVDGVEVISMTSTSVTINGETTFGNTVIVPPYLIQNAGVF